MSWLVGIDTGGTFTDLAAVDTETGKICTVKVPSIPANPAQAVMNSIEQLVAEYPVSWSDTDLLAHGTTVATNAILEGKGARAGLFINRGLGAIYPMRAGMHPTGPDLIDPYYTKPPELVSRALTREIRGRIGFDGQELEPLEREDVVRSALELKEQGVNSIAVCYLFSFVNPSHEQATREIISEVFPQCRVSISSDVLPVIREYPRLSTTVLDAYVGPVVSEYLEELASRLGNAGLNTQRFYIMQSSGGLKRMSLAVRYPNETLLSGPAAGVVFCQKLSEQSGFGNLLTFDMGGTSADMSVLLDGEVEETREGSIAGQDLGTPMIQIRTIGSGGGSIAFLGKDGLLKVGPESAGAVPGPACYGRGGTLPTVTDANVVLGYLSVDNFLGGRMAGNADLALKALSGLSREVRIDEVALAQGILKIVDTQMAVGLRMALMERGADPRDFVLVAFGGSGPVHAVRLGRELGIDKVLIPRFPGIACSMGLLNTVVKYVYLQSFITRFNSADPSAIAEGFEELRAKAMNDFRVEGLSNESSELAYQLDVRYPRQGYELSVDLGSRDGLPIIDLESTRERFHSQHHGYYGSSAPDEEPEIVNLRLVLRGELPQMKWSDPEVEPGDLLKGHRDAWFDSAGKYLSTPVYYRSRLAPGVQVDGPAIIEQTDSATILDPDSYLVVDNFGNLVIHLSGNVKG
ncbi:MAG: hydantoinase/oxoprolinase family protein [Actinobacteria bacterium]|jgi:N-methylhydantoinase A|nr:hydantoinase/oxoprolinase family protein [Actinomycetota bacterium]